MASIINILGQKYDFPIHDLQPLYLQIIETVKTTNSGGLERLQEMSNYSTIEQKFRTCNFLSLETSSRLRMVIWSLHSASFSAKLVCIFFISTRVSSSWNICQVVTSL